MKDKYIIGVNDIIGRQGYEVTLVKGFTTVSNAKFEGDSYDILESIIEYLDYLSDQYDCQVSIDSNSSRLLLLKIREYHANLTKKLFRTYNSLLPSRFLLGYTLTGRSKNNWDTIKKYIDYNKEYEDSTMIAVLSLLEETPEGYVKAFEYLQYLYDEVNKLETELGLK